MADTVMINTATPDMMAILKAVQAISCEIELDKFLATLIDILLEVGCAERVVLFAAAPRMGN